MEELRKPLEQPSPRMQPLARVPLFFAFQGKRAVVAGGTTGAAWKTELLSAAGAFVDVYADTPCSEILDLAADPPRGRIAIHRRGWTKDDLVGASLAIGAFDDDAAAAAFAAAARSLAVPVNVIDKPAYCDFTFGSIVNRSPLVIGISTDGAAPVFAQAIRAKLEAFLPKGFADWAAAAARWRERIKRSDLPFAGRRQFWQRFTEHAIKHPGEEPDPNELEAFIAEIKGAGGAIEHGSVMLVGAGPGDPELLTLRALRALQSADVILFDDLVSRDVLEFARREAKRLLVGKTGYGPSCRQDEINTLMVNLARSGKRVVRLKGGDPLVFGRAGEEIAACKAAKIAVEIIPGISAAQGAASALGISLTDRNHSRRLQYVTGHAAGGELPADFDFRSLADRATTTAIYMPTRTLAALVARALAEGLDPTTPAVAIAAATRPEQTVIADEVAKLPVRLSQAAPNGPVLVMLGCSLKNARQIADPPNAIALRG
jgi:uroporphyrin-III C-methyltransferase/precorrin-2 dehydrogenase/sirohydrochlorin ferrochelatase